MDENTAGSAIGDNGAGDVLTLTAEVVSAYVSKNPLPKSALPEVIAQVHQSLKALSGPKVEPRPELVPAVPIKKSVTPEYIVSLEDGRKFKSMKRYLGLRGMTPAEYRQKWGLPADYPMVAPNYAAQRSALAKTMGLGRKAAVSKPTKTRAKTSSKTR
jgi:predicted transcriptional regulator